MFLMSVDDNSQRKTKIMFRKYSDLIVQQIKITNKQLITFDNRNGVESQFEPFSALIFILRSFFHQIQHYYILNHIFMDLVMRNLFTQMSVLNQEFAYA